MAMTRASRAGVPLLVSCDWLASHLGRTRVLDTTWYMPIMQRDARAEHAAERIPGSRFLSVDEIDDTGCGLPHMLPSPAGFGAAMDELGVTNDDHVVVYDSTTVGCASHRAFWTFLYVWCPAGRRPLCHIFQPGRAGPGSLGAAPGPSCRFPSSACCLPRRAMGHERVSILDGGLGAWKAAGHDVERGPPPSPAEKEVRSQPGRACAATKPLIPPVVATQSQYGQYTARPDPSLVASMDRVADIVSTSLSGGPSELRDLPVLVDARSSGRCVPGSVGPRPSRNPPLHSGPPPPSGTSVTAEGEDEPWRAVYPRIRRGRIPNR